MTIFYGEQDGINWIWYYKLERTDNIVRKLSSWRAHKYEGRGWHPEETVPVQFCDATGRSGYGVWNTHILIDKEFGKMEKLSMHTNAELAKIAELRDADTINLLRQSAKSRGSIVNAVKYRITKAHKLRGSFGADAPGTIY